MGEPRPAASFALGTSPVLCRTRGAERTGFHQRLWPGCPFSRAEGASLPEATGQVRCLQLRGPGSPFPQSAHKNGYVHTITQAHTHMCTPALPQTHVHTHMHTHTHTSLHPGTHTSTHTHSHTLTDTPTGAHRLPCTPAHKHAHTDVHTHTYRGLHPHTHPSTHTDTHTLTHSHTHAQAHSDAHTCTHLVATSLSAPHALCHIPPLGELANTPMHRQGGARSQVDGRWGPSWALSAVKRGAIPACTRTCTHTHQAPSPHPPLRASRQRQEGRGRDLREGGG